MHHFIFPDQDTYICNIEGLDTENFGITEILKVGTSNKLIRLYSQTKQYFYTNAIFNHQSFAFFEGNFNGYLNGTIDDVYVQISGSNLAFTASYFNGLLNGVQTLTSGSISGNVSSAVVTGSLTASPTEVFVNGQITGSDANACLFGTGSGTDTRMEPNWSDQVSKVIHRSALQFDISNISSSIANGNILNPSFFLNLKVCNEYELPIAYTIFALPISQSWDMGDGYASDGGSDTGASWRYRDYNNGTSWYSVTISGSVPAIDFINNPSLATSSFGYGGGTWYTSSVASQSFGYESADISMDISSIVYQWISGSIPNNGLLLVTSDELQTTGSGFVLTFFSEDTNTIYSPYLDVGWDDSTFTTGSFTTSSIQISHLYAGITSSVASSSSFNINGGISGSFSSSAYMLISENISASILLDPLSGSGFVSGTGLSGNIINLPIYGTISASISLSQSLVTGSCGNNFSASIASGSFYSGPWSGSTFTAFYIDYKFENGILTGSWIEADWLGSSVTIPLPSGMDPYAIAYVNGNFISGKALGIYSIFNTTSASFNGQFIEGTLMGGNLNFQLTGSISTSSFDYTSSILFSSSSFNPLNVENPFAVSIRDIQPEYKIGDNVKIGIFGRKQFPLKTFERATQQIDYIIPEYLPSSSYYAIKDNITGEIVMDFDSYTRISCEFPYGNFFNLDTTSLGQERYYDILIRVVDGNNAYTIDTGKTFKITR